MDLGGFHFVSMIISDISEVCIVQGRCFRLYRPASHNLVNTEYIYEKWNNKCIQNFKEVVVLVNPKQN